MVPCAASRVRPSVRAWWHGALLPAAIFAVALALRLPFLSLVPAYSDEGNVALWGLDIARGRHLPLHVDRPVLRAVLRLSAGRTVHPVRRPPGSAAPHGRRVRRP